MIVKRKLYSVIDEEGNLGYYLYNEATGEERMFSVVEDERLYARGVGMAVQNATRMAQSKGFGAANKAANKIDLIKKSGTTKFINSDSKKLHSMRFRNKPIVPQQSGLPTQARSLHDKITMKGNLINDLKKHSGLPKGDYRLDHPVDFLGNPRFNYAKLM